MWTPRIWRRGADGGGALLGRVFAGVADGIHMEGGGRFAGERIWGLRTRGFAGATAVLAARTAAGTAGAGREAEHAMAERGSVDAYSANI